MNNDLKEVDKDNTINLIMIIAGIAIFAAFIYIINYTKIFSKIF